LAVCSLHAVAAFPRTLPTYSPSGFYALRGAAPIDNVARDSSHSCKVTKTSKNGKPSRLVKLVEEDFRVIRFKVESKNEDIILITNILAYKILLTKNAKTFIFRQ